MQNVNFEVHFDDDWHFIDDNTCTMMTSTIKYNLMVTKKEEVHNDDDGHHRPSVSKQVAH